jgi:hypothetical protein
MTFTDAYTQLRAAWPHQSFNIEVAVWHHDYTEFPYSKEPSRMEVRYSIWQNEAHQHHYGPTLEIALGLALNPTTALAEVDAQTEGLALIQGGCA